MFRPTICLCDRCSCMNDCGYYEETMKPILEGARTMLFEDEFTTRIKDALGDFTCDEFEVIE